MAKIISTRFIVNLIHIHSRECYFFYEYTHTAFRYCSNLWKLNCDCTCRSITIIKPFVSRMHPSLTVWINSSSDVASKCECSHYLALEIKHGSPSLQWFVLQNKPCHHTAKRVLENVMNGHVTNITYNCRRHSR